MSSEIPLITRPLERVVNLQDMIGGLKDKTTKFIADGSACFGKKIHFQQLWRCPLWGCDG